MDFPLLEQDMRGEFELRVEKVRRQMRARNADGLLVASSINLFYLAGGVYRGYIYIGLESDPVVFMIPPAEWKGAHSIRKPEQIPAIIGEQHAPKRLALEFDDLFYSEIERLAKLWPDAEIVNGSAILRGARIVKTDKELEMMREDGRRQAAVYSRIKYCYQEDMTDMEFQIEIERMLRREGCLGYLRAAGSRMELNMGSVISGANADVPSPYDFSMGGAGADPSLPVGASGTTMHPGVTVMVDMNGGFNGYQTDMTRVWSIGSIPDRAHECHECSRAILRDLERFSLPSEEIGEMYRRASKIASEAGLHEYFMGHRFHVAFIGHGVGIELNEQPVVMERNKMKLEKGMTIALEPKFVLPEIGALGVENTYIVTDKGLENITVLNEEIQEL